MATEVDFGSVFQKAGDAVSNCFSETFQKNDTLFPFFQV